MAAFFRKTVPARLPVTRVVVGLGNPGAEYRNTRHNVGFMVMERLADTLKVGIATSKFHSLIGQGTLEGHGVLLVKPLTYMNLSGQAVRDALRFHSLAPADLLVIADDVNLPLGRLRLRPDGSAGGHNGLKSIIADLGAEAFPRLRIGVGAPNGAPLRDYVLGKWERDELPIVHEQVDRAAEAVACALTEGVEAAMNRYNVKM